MNEAISHKYNTDGHDYRDGFNQQHTPNYADISDAQAIESLKRLDTLVQQTRDNISGGQDE